MKYTSELVYGEYAHEGLTMPEFDSVLIEFSTEEMQALAHLWNVAQSDMTIGAITTNGIEPTVTPILNGHEIDDGEVNMTDWSRALYACEVSVRREGYVSIAWTGEYNDDSSWVDGFRLDDLPNQ